MMSTNTKVEGYSVKKEITYAEKLCQELEKQLLALEKKLQEDETKIKNARNKQAIMIELKEVQKLLKKHTEQLDHLRTHDSVPLRMIMTLTLVIFFIWMIFVLKNNWGRSSIDIQMEGLF